MPRDAARLAARAGAGAQVRHGKPKGPSAGDGDGEVSPRSCPPRAAARSRSTCSGRRAGRRSGQCLGAARRNARHGGSDSGILASQAKEFGIYDFPFMFASPKEADAIVDGPFGRMLHQKLEPRDRRPRVLELGFRQHHQQRRPINKVDDIAGLKLRVIPNAINVDWVKALGANPTPLPFPRCTPRSTRRRSTGRKTPATVISANKLYEVQKHIVLSNHQYNPQSLISARRSGTR